MKDLIFGGLLALTVGCSQSEIKILFAENPKELELKVGDKMPKLNSQDIIGKSIWHDDIGSKHGYMKYYRKGKFQMIAAYLNCNGKEILFGIYDSEINKVFLDKDPNDGIIDGIIENAERSRFIAYDAPECQI